MLDIFTNTPSLEEILISEKYPNWLSVIDNKANIYLNIDDELLSNIFNGDDDDDNLLFTWYHESDTAKLPQALSEQFDIDNNKELILECPYGIFLWDIDRLEANELTCKYGLKVFSSKSFDDLEDFEIDEVLEKDSIVENKEKNYRGYKYILEKMKFEATNGCVIVDRNLFSNVERRKNVGVENMKNFFDSILPQELETHYDILFVTENTGSLYNDASRNKIIESLIVEIQKQRKYSINIELLLVNRNVETYEFTHNREFLSNYHFADSKYGFAIFSVRDYAKVRKDNDFELIIHYHSLCKNVPNLSSIKKRERFFKRLREIKKEAEDKLNKIGQSDDNFRLYLNGKESFKIINRLL